MNFREYKLAELEWFKGLKVGDEVAVSTSKSWGRCGYEITKVAKITPSGRVKTENNYEFNTDNTVRGRDDYAKLEPITDNILDIVNRYNSITYIENIAARNKLKEMPTSDLLRIQEILKNTFETE